MELRGRIFRDESGRLLVEAEGNTWLLQPDGTAVGLTPVFSPNGRIYRDADGSTVVEIAGRSDLLKEAGVICLNPEAEPDVRLYQKRFRKKRIYLPHEYEKAKAVHLSHPDSFTVTMNGFTELTPEFCRQYGLVDQAYEAACAKLFHELLKGLRQNIPGAHLQIIDGATPKGVDGAIIKVAGKMNILSLGFSCPEFMFYVNDDDRTVYVAESKDAYGDAFIRSTDLVICTGGREHALMQDISASCLYEKHIHFVDLLSRLSTHGNVPAVTVEPSGRRRINNASAVFGKNISFFSNANISYDGLTAEDAWPDVFKNCTNVATGLCRKRMSPEHMFD